MKTAHHYLVQRVFQDHSQHFIATVGDLPSAQAIACRKSKTARPTTEIRICGVGEDRRLLWLTVYRNGQPYYTAEPRPGDPSSMGFQQRTYHTAKVETPE